MNAPIKHSDLLFVFPDDDFSGEPLALREHLMAMFKRERDHALLHGPSQWAMHVSLWHSRELTPEEAERSFHQTRTAVVTIGTVARRTSKAWCEERGLESFDDGDLQ